MDRIECKWTELEQMNEVDRMGSRWTELDQVGLNRTKWTNVD